MTSIDAIGKYQILGVLGQGGMGVVYKALDPSIGRQVAIKTIHKHLLSASTGADKIARFSREAQAAGRFMHRNIVTVFEYGDYDGAPYLVMEFVEGRELTEVLAEKRALSPAEVLETFSQVCAGLEHAHQKEVIHRDLKPANIFVLPDGTVKIADFGIARIQNAALDITGTGEILGTPYYMSPEQLMSKDIDARSDLFSLAVVMYEALTGVRPFHSDAVTGVLLKILQESPPAPTSINPELPSSFDAFFAKALHKSPESRFQTAAELKTALSEAVASREPRHGATPPAAPTFRADDLAIVEGALTKRLGPISKVMVKRKSLTLPSLSSLIDALAQEIPNETERQRFVSELAKLRSSDSPSEAKDPVAESPGGIGNALDAGYLAKLEAALTAYLGPVAKVIVKRSAGVCPSKEELCGAVASQIANPEDRRKFLALMAAEN